MQNLARHLAHGSVRTEGNARSASVAVLNYRLVTLEVERHHQCARRIRGGQRASLPATGRESERGVLELGFRRRQPGGQLAQHLRMGV
jgi:hypothetical protein